MAKIDVKGTSVTVYTVGDKDFISLTDMIRAKDGDFFISDWLRNRNTVEFPGIWEQVHNPNFNYGGFAIIKSQREQLDWDIRRNLTKINYRIHTDNIKTRMTELFGGPMQFEVTIDVLLASRPLEGTP